MAQDGIGLVQDEVSILELGELRLQTRGLERALQPGLLSHHFLLLPALALVSQQHMRDLTVPLNREVDGGVRRHGCCVDKDSGGGRVPRQTYFTDSARC